MGKTEDMKRERERINFVIKRDGLDAAIKWAEQTRDIYIKHAIKYSRYNDSVEELTRFIDDMESAAKIGEE